MSLPSQSHFLPYLPVCPYGCGDCIYDPAYIKYYYPDDYKLEFGDISPEEAIKTNGCLKVYKTDSNFCMYYDDEDK